MTKQEIFDTVAIHMLTQGRKSEDEQGCLYRGPNGLKCAVGVLISDAAYKPSLENRIVCEGIIWKALEDSGIKMTEEIEIMLSDLQSIHDDTRPEVWKQRLASTGARHGLKINAIENFTPEKPTT